jgi:CBS domain containing-hemolysin-like protein
MVSRRRISALDIDTPLEQVTVAVAQSPYSRLPVYRGSIDNVVGMLHTKDLVRWHVSGAHDVSLASLLRPIASVHESVTADRVLRELRERRTHQALVVDEFGGTAGLLTLEDVLAELLGGVGDEFKSGNRAAEPTPDGRIRVPGVMPVDEAATLFDAHWDTDAATVGGLVTSTLGRLPTPGDLATVGTYEFEVERVVDRAVASVLVRRLTPNTSEDDA